MQQDWSLFLAADGAAQLRRIRDAGYNALRQRVINNGTINYASSVTQPECHQMEASGESIGKKKLRKFFHFRRKRRFERTNFYTPLYTISHTVMMLKTQLNIVERNGRTKNKQHEMTACYFFGLRKVRRSAIGVCGKI